jgi:polyisoprenyl-phosphate glycosyltransferase
MNLIESDNQIKISVIVPVYKEEGNIEKFTTRMVSILEKMGFSYEIIFCFDPSPDRTEEIIYQEIEKNSKIRLIKFSRRFGQPAATMAGILLCNGKVCAIIDVDLQDPPELIPEMYNKINEGYEVVYAKRRSRKGETIIKKIVSHVGYKIINYLSDIYIPSDTGDFRLITRRCIQELRKLNETHGFLRGLVAYVGFRQYEFLYDRDERHSGKGNYNRYIGSLKIGLNGIISFSSKPLQLMSIFGAFFSLVSFLMGGWYFVQKIIGVNYTPGLPTTVLAITFFSGVQLLALGLIGEYVGRIYDEVKGRSLFIIDKKVNF